MIMINFRKQFLAILYCFFLSPVFSQIENVIVETYYISDANDASDTIGGGVEIGSKTYRIYLDLLPGTRVKKIYGDENHPLIFSSTENFFNNKVDGQTFGKEFSKNRLQENTVALDSWLTLGQTTRNAAITYFGVLKQNDSNGSFIGGANNDGGSEAIADGLLSNTAIELGIPLTEKDGMDTAQNVPGAWGDYGFIDVLTDIDSTIFGSVISGNNFNSRNAGLLNSGVTGVDSLLNHVLVAQLTTKGEISFELNIEVEIPQQIGFQTIKYVANDSVLLDGEVLNPLLKYPQECGCQDPNYLEYSSSYACNIQDSCQTLIVLGCMDPMACNFDANANFNIQEICCYVGLCNDLDMSILCPELKIEDVLLLESTLQVYPNPTQSFVTIKGSFIKGEKYQLEIFDFSGKRVKTISFTNLNSGNTSIDFSGFPDGIYNLRFVSSKNVQTGRVIKN
jgi:hypothetical protein